jgi:hypothetical protein
MTPLAYAALLSVLTVIGSCLFIYCIAILLKKYFDYQDRKRRRVKKEILDDKLDYRWQVGDDD